MWRHLASHAFIKITLASYNLLHVVIRYQTLLNVIGASNCYTSKNESWPRLIWPTHSVFVLGTMVVMSVWLYHWCIIYLVKAGVVCFQVKLCDPHLSALEVRFSRWGATQTLPYLTLSLLIKSLLTLSLHGEVNISIKIKFLFLDNFARASLLVAISLAADIKVTSHVGYRVLYIVASLQESMCRPINAVRSTVDHLST